MSQIAISARERPAFRSVRRALAGGERVVPGFEAGECRATVDGIECRGRRYGGAFRDWPDLATCRGVTPFQPQLALPRPRWPSNRSYRFGRFLIERGYMCPGCRALGPSFFNMTFYRARAAGRPRR